MPWRCPACHIPIGHSDLEPKPRVGQRYRCHVCRLELEFDEVRDRLTVPPLPSLRADQAADRQVRKNRRR